MNQDEKYMSEAIGLAYRGLGGTYPNPVVGCVIVSGGRIIGRGYHRRAGEPHAEVNAVDSLADKSLLPHSTLYVTLEPCAHYGKTPPCADMIVSHGIPRVVVGTLDPFAQVNGQGIKKMRDSGVEVEVGVLENECRELNKRFFTYHQKKRPFVILKWAQTSDGFIDRRRHSPDTPPLKITGPEAQRYVHDMRSREQAILVGTRTAFLDDPRLDARMAAEVRHPLRVTLDRAGIIPESHHLKDGSIQTLVFTQARQTGRKNLEYVSIDFSVGVAQQILDALYTRGIQSVIVEGGTKLLNTFIDRGLWDELFLFTAPLTAGDGVASPALPQGARKERTLMLGKDVLEVYKNVEQ